MPNQDDSGAMFWQSPQEQLVGALQRPRCELQLARTLMRPTSERRADKLNVVEPPEFG